MGLQSMKGALRDEVRSEKNKVRFDEAKKKNTALAGHETVMSVLGVLGDESPRRYAEKDAVTRALVREYQERPHAFWGAVLVLAYSPMLNRLRGRIRGDAFAPDDLDQLVVTTFLEVVDTYPLDRWADRICLRLRQSTERRVFRALRDEQRVLDFVRSEEPDDLLLHEQLLVQADRERGWPDTRPAPRHGPDPKEVASLVTFLVRHAGDVLEQSRLDLVVATMVRGERLSAYVDRVYPDLEPAERRRTYQRIKRRHSRTLVRLREVLAPLHCPRTTPSDALPPRGQRRPEGGER